jgi:hypothetical protein
MAQIKVIYKNANGFDQEHSEAADSIKMLSFLTSTKELTDAKIAHLVDGADAANEHVHDLRYFQETEFIAASAGAADAGKPIKTGATGVIPVSLLDIAGIESGLTHNGLSDAAASTAHTAFPLLAGGRNFSAVQSYSSALSISTAAQLVHKQYVDDAIVAAHIGTNWQNAKTRLATPPLTPVTGDIVLIDGTLGALSGVFIGHDNSIAIYGASSYTFRALLVNEFISVDDEASLVYQYNGTVLVPKIFEATTASLGLVKSGLDIRLDSSAAGNGLSLSSGALAVNVDGASLEITTDALNVKASGIKSAMIDFGTGAGQVKAAAMPIVDTLGYYTTKNVEAALAQLAVDIGASGVSYVAGLGGVTKGDLVYISSANTVLPFGSLSSDGYAVGIALETAIAAAPVKVLANDTAITGVLTGATPGVKYYWTGSAYSATIPAGSGNNVWRVGVAKNATDLSIEVEHVKRNA